MSRVDGSVSAGPILTQSSQSQVVIDQISLVELQPNQIIDAKVVLRRDQSNPEKLQKGIIVGGEFVEVTLPAEIEEGQQVKLQVVRVSGENKLVYLELVDKESTTPEVELIAKELNQLLRGISLNKQTLNIIKSDLTHKINSDIINTKELSSADSSSSLVTKLLSSILNEEILENPTLLEEKLASSNSQELASVLRQLKKLVENSSPFNRSELTKVRDELIKVMSDFLTQIRDESDLSIKLDHIKELPKAEKLPASQAHSTPPLKRAIIRLLDLLSEIGNKGSDLIVEGEKKLREVFNNQIDILKSVESRVKKLLVSSTYDTALDTLLKSVESIEFDKEEPINTLDRRYKEFISDLKVDLKLIKQGSLSDQESRELLQKNLDRLYKDLQLPKLEERADKPIIESIAIVYDSLTQQQKTSLKNIEAQLQNILLTPSASLIEYSKADLKSSRATIELRSKDLIKLLSELENIIIQSSEQSSPFPKEMVVAAEKYIFDIKKLTQEKLPILEIEREIKLLTLKLFKELSTFGFSSEKTITINQNNPLKDFDIKLLNLITKELKDILTLPQTKLAVIIDNESIGNLPSSEVQSKELKRFQLLLDLIVRDSLSVTDHSYESIKEVSKNIQYQLKEVLVNPASQKELDIQLRSIIREALTKFENTLNMVKDENHDVINDKKINNAIITLPHKEVLRNIEQLLIEIIDDADPIIVLKNQPLKSDLLILNNQTKFKELLLLLRNVELIIPDPANPLEQEFIEFASSLSDSVERESRRSTHALNDLLKKSLEHIQARFIKNSTQASNELFAIANQQGLATLESIVQGQEVMSKIAPLMQSLGEPAMAIFPFLIQGFLSKIELQTGPRKADLQNKNKNKKKSDNNEGFEQVRLDIPLPNLGLVRVGIAHRSSQILISFAFERSELAHYINERIPKLESVLKNSGFEQVEINCIGSQAKERGYDWLENVITQSSIVA